MYFKNLNCNLIYVPTFEYKIIMSSQLIFDNNNNFINDDNYCNINGRYKINCINV